MNAFHLARPRGADAPAKVPKKPKKAPVPITYSNKRVLNAAGKWQAYLEPARHSIVIETAEQASAGNDKRQKIVRGLS
jgi:hypothetical protein